MPRNKEYLLKLKELHEKGDEAGILLHQLDFLTRTSTASTADAAHAATTEEATEPTVEPTADKSDEPDKPDVD